MTIDEADPTAWANKVWSALNQDNKVSLFVRFIDLSTQERQDVIINQLR